MTATAVALVLVLMVALARRKGTTSMPMKMSAKGLQLLKRLEGVVLRVYKDSAGLPTIGVGHLLVDPSRYQGAALEREVARIMSTTAPITEAQATALLARDVERFERAVAAAVTVPLEQYQFDALVSFAFNVGESALARSGVVRAVNERRLADVPAALLVWNKRREPSSGQLVVDAGLTRRRTEEGRLFSGLS
jgi:lysozyme